MARAAVIVRRRALVLCAMAGALAGCTLLAEFVDEPAGDCVDGGCAGQSLDGSPDAVGDGRADATDVGPRPDVFDAGPPDVATLCKGRGTGWYCGFNGLNGTAPSKDDLVECREGGVYAMTLCDAGCLSYPSGVPDRCNECPGKKDGLYCGSEFPSARPANATIVVRCTKGEPIIDKQCAPLACVDDAGGFAVCK